LAGQLDAFGKCCHADSFRACEARRPMLAACWQHSWRARTELAILEHHAADSHTRPEGRRVHRKERCVFVWQVHEANRCGTVGVEPRGLELRECERRVTHHVHIDCLDALRCRVAACAAELKVCTNVLKATEKAYVIRLADSKRPSLWPGAIPRQKGRIHLSAKHTVDEHGDDGSRRQTDIAQLECLTHVFPCNSKATPARVGGAREAWAACGYWSVELWIRPLAPVSSMRGGQQCELRVDPFGKSWRRIHDSAVGTCLKCEAELAQAGRCWTIGRLNQQVCSDASIPFACV
jgi:hypothetical protein